MGPAHHKASQETLHDLEDTRGPWHGGRFDAVVQLSNMALRIQGNLSERWTGARLTHLLS